MSVIIEELPNDEPSPAPSTRTEPHSAAKPRAANEEPEFHEAEDTLLVEEPEEHFADCVSDEEGVTDLSEAHSPAEVALNLQASVDVSITDVHGDDPQD